MALTTADWAVTGYQDPLVLAVVTAAVSGFDLTVQPMVAHTGGDLVVASDLTLTQIEWRATPRHVRLRRSGSGNFDTYFDDAGTPLYPDAKMWLVLEDAGGDPVTIPCTIANTASGFNNWIPDDSAQDALLDAVATNDDILIAIANPSTAEPSTAGAEGVFWTLNDDGDHWTFNADGDSWTLVDIFDGDAAAQSWTFAVPDAEGEATVPGNDGDATPQSWSFDVPAATGEQPAHDGDAEAQDVDVCCSRRRGRYHAARTPR